MILHKFAELRNTTILDSKLSKGFCPVTCYTKTLSFAKDDRQMSKMLIAYLQLA